MDKSKRDYIRDWTHNRLHQQPPMEDEPLDWNLQMLDAIDNLEDKLGAIFLAYSKLSIEEQPEEGLRTAIIKSMLN